ncbi:MAG: hypothetical protein ACC657_18145 [Thiohalomonadales bacterium]
MLKAADKKLIENSDIPSKVERQEAFLMACKQEGLSSQEIVERASVFPSGEKSRVLKWPKL